MRNWDDVVFYRAEKALRYRHIDSLFTREIDWKLIETHWQDMMQVVLSIQAGLVLPSMLLRKLGSQPVLSQGYQLCDEAQIRRNEIEFVAGPFRLYERRLFMQLSKVRFTFGGWRGRGRTQPEEKED